MINQIFMKVSKTNLLAYVLLVISLLFSIYTKLQEQKAKEELKRIAFKESTNVKDSILEKRLQSFDSLLSVGKYETALNIYSEELDTLAKNDKDFVKFRINLVKQFVHSQNLRKKVISNDNENSEASVTNSMVSDTSSQNSLDSLSLALTKTKSLLKKVQNELRSKSFGAYLRFKNPKRHKIHYVGNTSKGKAYGYGIAIYDTGSRYEGEWKNNLREGKGSFYWTDGQYYIGEYKNDLRTGKGTYFWPNGEKYVGEWRKDKRDGKGVFYNKKGKIMTSGIWKKDKLVKEDKNKH